MTFMEWIACSGILLLVLVCAGVWLCGVSRPSRQERRLQREVREAVELNRAWRAAHTADKAPVYLTQVCKEHE